MANENTDTPQPISMEDSLRIWNLKKQNKPLSEKDVELLNQACRWQMWVSHGILLQNGSSESDAKEKDLSTALSNKVAS